MTKVQNLILTSGSAELIAAINDVFSDISVLVVGSTLDTNLPFGSHWCFVDWTLPEISGLEMCRRIRATPSLSNCHLTLVLVEDDEQARLRALKAGADDYIIGPLTAPLLISRMKGYLGLASGLHREGNLSHGDFAVDRDAHQVNWRNIPIRLQPNQYRLLAHFIENPGKVYSRPQLINILGKRAGSFDERTVDVWIGRLRRATMAVGAPDPLRTVRSFGYVMDRPYPNK